jgi:hypothetical protein
MARIKKAQGGDTLSKRELSALAHQKRGMGKMSNTFVKKSGAIRNETGQLTDSQMKQLKDYMGRSSKAEKVYQALPNVGRMVGKSAADIPKGSKLEKQRSGGKMKKAKAGKQMLKRADGSYSQRGLWDNIRANKGSGKKPTAQMLKQERKIKASSKKK